MEISIELLDLLLKFSGVIIIPIAGYLLSRFKKIEEKQVEIEKDLANKLGRHEASELISHSISDLRDSVSKLHDDIRLVINTMITNKSPPS